MSSKKLNPKLYVITDGDEGVQLNDGIRLAFAGAGYQLPGFTEAVEILRKQLKKKLRIASHQESQWMKHHLDLEDWEQIDASGQQHVQAVAEANDLLYAGYIPFTDPIELKYGVKAHMVRPKTLHLANKICFTLGGGEQTYNLGQYLISADWVSFASQETVEEMILAQVKFYQDMVSKEMPLIYQTGGKLGEDVAQKNLETLQNIGLELNEA
jgi:hypothetical protein